MPDHRPHRHQGDHHVRTRSHRPHAGCSRAGAGRRDRRCSLAGCTSNDSDDRRRRRQRRAPQRAAGAQRRARRDGHHRLLRPGGRPRLARLRSTSPPRPRPRSTTTSTCSVAEGTNDANLQISQVETFINDRVDAIVLLPSDGAALTEVATQGDGGRHPGHQRRPRVLQPVRRPHHGPRRQLRHGRLAPARTSASSSRRQASTTRSSPRSPASTRCR